MEQLLRTNTGGFNLEESLKLEELENPVSYTHLLVIVSREASDNTKKKFANMCTYYEVPICIFGNKEELGRAMGKEMRASLAVTDQGFAKAMVKKLNLNGGSKYESE